MGNLISKLCAIVAVFGLSACGNVAFDKTASTDEIGEFASSVDLTGASETSKEFTNLFSQDITHLKVGHICSGLSSYSNHPVMVNDLDFKNSSGKAEISIYRAYAKTESTSELNKILKEIDAGLPTGRLDLNKLFTATADQKSICSFKSDEIASKLETGDIDVASLVAKNCRINDHDFMSKVSAGDKKLLLEIVSRLNDLYPEDRKLESHIFSNSPYVIVIKNIGANYGYVVLKTDLTIRQGVVESFKVGKKMMEIANLHWDGYTHFMHNTSSKSRCDYEKLTLNK